MFRNLSCNSLQRICNQVRKSESVIYDCSFVPLLLVAQIVGTVPTLFTCLGCKSKRKIGSENKWFCFPWATCADRSKDKTQAYILYPLHKIAHNTPASDLVYLLRSYVITYYTAPWWSPEAAQCQWAFNYSKYNMKEQECVRSFQAEFRTWVFWVASMVTEQSELVSQDTLGQNGPHQSHKWYASHR